MSGYKLQSDSYKRMLETDKTPDLNRITIQKKIKVLDFLATCDDDEITELFNSSAFNDIVKGYLKMALDKIDLEEIEIDLDDDEKIALRKGLLNEFRYLFDTVSAAQAEDYYNNH